MLEQLGKPIKFVAFLTASDGTGVTNASVTVTVYSPAGTRIVFSDNASELGSGFYSYELSGSHTTIVGEYVALFRTTDVRVVAKQVPSLWVVGRGGVENLDAKVSSRKIDPVAPPEPPGELRIWTYRLTLPDGITPITSANVWVTRDPQGLSVLASGLTNYKGEVVFHLPLGEIYIWKRKAGFKFTNPDKEVIT